MSTSKDKIQQFMESPLVAWVSGGVPSCREGEAGERLVVSISSYEF